MLAELGCRYVIIGHSERREHFGETEQRRQPEDHGGFEAGLIAIVCVGEESGATRSRLDQGLCQGPDRQALAGLGGEEAAQIVVAYEPIWAIGTGRSSTGADANEVVRLIRATLAEMYGETYRRGNPYPVWRQRETGNIKEFMAYPEIDGGLVGGAVSKWRRLYRLSSTTDDRISQSVRARILSTRRRGHWRIIR